MDYYAEKILEDVNPAIDALVIMGPTASGKSALAMRVAEIVDAELISADSMQAYRGMDIGTAKPTPEERTRTRHHLIDFLDISEPLDVFTYIDEANAAIRDIRARGVLPVVVGGTGLYIRSLIYGLDPLPADRALRSELDALYDSDEGFEELRNLMSSLDSIDYERWKNDRRRLIRALEVFRITGISITELQKTWSGEPVMSVKAWRLAPERDVLREAIAERTDVMLSAGWIEETKALLARGLAESPTAKQAIGYPIIAEYLNDAIDAGTMRDSIVTATRRYARRQNSWFGNKHPEARPLSPEPA
ncbi:MAG: tRNA (adenosine(37)-N6)-dimethylallyltransferase MiaA [Kiritimatiellaeota bacterium]|nr:tRNA (adenosine(37)-N6)-dimethylallyltransferase MiaA [Kiritimatiellota bacterium]